METVMYDEVQMFIAVMETCVFVVVVFIIISIVLWIKSKLKGE